MDPATVVAVALAAGGAAGMTNAASTAVTDAYQGLKTLVLGRFRSGGVEDDEALILIAGADDPEVGRTALTGELNRVGVDEPTVEAARHLLELLEERKGKFVIDASQAKGLIVGDHGEQHNTFN